mgnify:CR=1 FL=1
MKHLAQIIILLAIVSTGILVAPVAADPVNEPGQGYITVTNPPVADFFTSTRFGPAPFTVSFSDSSRGYTPMTYQWEFGDGTNSTLRNPKHAYKKLGYYTVNLTVWNGMGSDTLSKKDFITIRTNSASGLDSAGIKPADNSNNVARNQ